MKIEFYKHSIGEEEKRNVLECLDGIFLTTGSYVSEFENRFSECFGLNYSVGLTSCTAALHLSLLALGIGPGDEVITTPMTFIATVTPIMHAGAKPIFVDVEKETGLIDPDLIESAITERTKLILPVHLYGQMCDMKKIKKVADKHNLRIIEDAAHCIEGERAGVKPGHLGDVACFSFYATKNITSGEGGAIATSNKEIADKVRLLRQHGMSKEAADRYSGVYKHWDMVECGWKYNMDNIQASLLLPQLKKVDEQWQRREKVYNKYVDYLNKVSQIDYPKIKPDSKSAYHLFTIWVEPERRDKILHLLGEKKIGVAVNYRSIHLLTYFRETFGFRRGDFPVAESIGDRTISLPFYPQLSDEEIRFVAETLRKVV
ncbi:MAG: DegT/DnrJ/EryC1/StrS family aminotransferase [Candidatus Bathyarchaeota archaeon]